MVTLGKSKKVCKYSSSKGKRVKTNAQSHESQAFMFTSTRTQMDQWKKQQSGAVGEGKHFEVCVDIGGQCCGRCEGYGRGVNGSVGLDQW